VPSVNTEQKQERHGDGWGMSAHFRIQGLCPTHREVRRMIAYGPMVALSRIGHHRSAGCRDPAGIALVCIAAAGNFRKQSDQASWARVPKGVRGYDKMLARLLTASANTRARQGACMYSPSARCRPTDRCATGAREQRERKRAVTNPRPEVSEQRQRRIGTCREI
jgi:hypothetical protein